MAYFGSTENLLFTITLLAATSRLHLDESLLLMLPIECNDVGIAASRKPAASLSGSFTGTVDWTSSHRRADIALVLYARHRVNLNQLFHIEIYERHAAYNRSFPSSRKF